MLGTRLKEILNEKKISLTEYAEMCDLPLETVRNIYYGKSVDPKLSTALKMANALDLSVNCLLGQCHHTMQERVLIQNYRDCGKHGKSIIELIARYEASAVKNEREGIAHKIPCIVPRGDIHKGLVYDLCETNEIETTVAEAYIAIEITTNDLVPSFCKGDILLFENRFPTNGEIASFYKGDRAYIRKYIEENNQYRLKCIHQHGEDLVLKRMDEVEYIGTIVGVHRG